MNHGTADSRERLKKDRLPAIVRGTAGVLLIAFVLQAAIAARRDSVTVDEFVHLPVGLYMLLERDFRPDPINPPLSRMIPALPLLLSRPAFHPALGTPHWGMGSLFMDGNRGQYQRIFVIARCTTILLASALALLVFHWAQALYGWEAALASMFLFAFSPSMIAHGHLVTADLPGALGFTVTVYALWRWLERPSLFRAMAVGLSLGIAIALKLSCLMLVAIIPTLATIGIWGRRGATRQAGVLFFTTTTAVLLVINLAYGFDGSFSPLDRVGFPPAGKLSSLGQWAPWLRLPVPVSFLQGLDLVLTGDAPHEPTYFLGGELSLRGWWYYHLAAYALKTPLPLLILAATALGLWLTGRAGGRRECCLFVPILFVFAVNSLLSPLDIGVRHVLAVDPLFFIAVSPLLAAPIRALREGRRTSRDLVAGLVSVTALVWLVTGTLWVAPRYLEYFNEIAGGPRNGHRWLIDSNLDWGQDLIRLSEYMTEHDVESIHLAYFGRVNPAVYGIRFQPVEDGRSHGLAAISPSLLMGRPYFVWLDPGTLAWVKAGSYTWLRKYDPVARVGGMFLYHLP